MAFSSAALGILIWVGLCWHSMTLFADPIINDLHLQARSQFYLIITLASTGNTIVALLAYGQIVARLGVRKTCIVGGLGCTLGYVILAVSPSIVLMYVGALIYGFSLSLVNVNNMNLVIQKWLSPSRMGTFVGICHAISSIAGVIFEIVVAAWIASMGYHIVLWAIAAISCVGTFIVAGLYKGDPEQLNEPRLFMKPGEEAQDEAGNIEIKQEGPSYKAMLRKPRFWALAFVELLTGIIGFAVYSNLTLFAVDMGYGDMSGIVLSVALASSAISMVPLGLLADKFKSKTMIIVALGFLIVAAAILLKGTVPLAVLFFVAVCLGIAYNLVCIPMGLTALESFGNRDYSKKLGTFNGLMFGGCSLAPIMFSGIYDLTGQTYTYSLIFVIVCAVICGLLITPLTRRPKADFEDAAE